MDTQDLRNEHIALNTRIIVTTLNELINFGRYEVAGNAERSLRRLPDLESHCITHTFDRIR